MGAPASDRADAPRLIALFGPTSVGKSEVALAVARRLAQSGRKAVIIGADSMQLYQGLELITGVTTASERGEVEHRLIGCIPVTTQFSVGQYAALAHSEIDAVIADGGVPLVVGGTGLYLQAALTGMPLRPPIEPDRLAALEQRLVLEGAASLHAELAQQSAAAAERIEPSDQRRLLRALALLEQGESVDDDPGGIWTARMRHPTCLIGLTRERSALYERIDARADQIVAAGGADEVHAAVEAGASRTASMALGFRELQQDDLELMKQQTRRYAKRQLTWMRRLETAELLALDSLSADQAAEAVLASFKRSDP